MRLAALTALPVLATLLVACGSTPEPKRAERPANVPATAQAIQAPYGSGAWALCTPSGKEASHYTCTVWDELQGKVWAEGDYELRKPYRDPFTAEKRYVQAPIPPHPFQILEYDGDKILLAENYVLFPVKK